MGGLGRSILCKLCSSLPLLILSTNISHSCLISFRNKKPEMAKATKLSSFFLCCINGNLYGFERTSVGDVGPFHLSKER